MIESHSLLAYLPDLMFTLCIIVWLVESDYRDSAFAGLIRKFLSFSVPHKFIVALIFVSYCQWGGSKSGMTNNAPEQPSAPSGQQQENGTPAGRGRTQPMSGQSSGPQRLTANQYAAGFALVTQTVSDTSSWLAMPSNAVVHYAWACYGAARDSFWLPATNWDFVLGTNAVEGALVSSSGTLSFWRPKGSPHAAEMPDGTGISFLAPLQGRFGIVPPGGRFWHAVTDSNSVLFTWQDVFAGRDTNSPVSFQAELFWNGDFTYRYAFPSNSSILNPNSSFTNFVIGAQHNGGGETYALNDTNLLFNGLELRWRAFGILDPGIDDHDGDGLSTYDEVMKYGTDPRLPDSDFDGLGDKQEVETPGLNALRRDSHGYGMPDGSNPQSLPWSISDGNANGLPDDWEAYWFGTNGTSGAYADDNHDGFSNLANLLTGTDPAKAPPPGFAVTNGVPVAGIDAWEIAPAFALEMQSGLTNILTREIQAGRTSPWQQFFVSSKPSAAGAWSLDGLELSWEDGTNVSGAATASPSGDSLRLGLSSCLFEKLTVRLAPSRTSGLVRSPAPLYLVRWTPQPAFTPSVTVAAATSSNGVPCVAAVLEAGGAAALPFTIATSARPHKAPPAQDETGERAQPPDPGSAVTPVFTSGQTSGYLTAPYPSEAALPAPCGSAPIRVLLYKIEIVSTGGTALTRPFGQLSPPYPLDTAALRSKWLNNAVATDSADSPGFTVSTGLNSEFLRIRINGEETGSFMWPESSAAPRAGLAAMGAAASLRASSLCAGGCVGAGVECLLCASNIVDQCVERDPDDYTKDDDPPGGDGEKDKPTCACGDPEGGAFNSVDFRIPLGTPGPGRISGFLWFSMATPQTVTPGIFNVLGDPTVIVETNDYGVITVTCTAPNGRSLTISGMTGGACVRVYDSHGAYVHRWEISNPGGVYSDTVQLVKFDQADNPVSDSTYFYHGGGGYWSRVDGLDGATETLDITGDLDAYGWRNEERMLISGGVTLSGTLTCRQVIGAGSAAVSRVTRLDTWDGFTGRWLSRQSLYWKDNLNAQRNGSLKLRFGDGIPWAYSACDIRGRETLGAGPLDGSAYFPGMTNRDDILTPGDLAALPGFACAAKAYGYAPDAVAGDSADYSDSRSPRETVSYVIRNGTATVTAREWHVYTRTHGADGSVTVRTIRAASAAAAIDDGGNAVSYTSAYAGSEEPAVDAALWNLPLSEAQEDGTLLTWSYSLDGNTLTVTARRGTVANPDGIANVSTYEVETRDTTSGRTLRRETRLYTGGGEGTLLSWNENYFDNSGHLLLTSYSDGTSLQNVWDCCHLQETAGRDGKVTEFINVPGQSHKSVTGEFSLGGLPGANGLYPAVETFTDALGRETRRVLRVYFSNNPANDPAYPDLATSTEYPYGTDGYSVTTDPLGVQTVSRTAYASNSVITETASAGVTNRTTQVWGGATTGQKNWDGKWTRETRTTSYGAGGCRTETVTLEASDMPAAVTASETVYDFLGRVVSVSAPQSVISNVYDGSTPRILRASRTGSPDTLYVYDALGNVAATALDADSDGQISAADTVTASRAAYVQDGGIYWRETTQSSVRNGWTNVVSTVREQLTGLTPQLLGRTVSIAPNGQTTTTETALDTDTHIQTATAQTDGVATPDLRRTLYSYPVETQSSANRMSYTYDGFARAASQTEATPDGSFVRAVRTVEYDAFGNGVTNRATYGGLTTVASTSIDSQGRATARTDAGGNTTHTGYDSFGQTISLSGATYPVACGYDTAGRRTALTTYRDENAGGDTTRWLYRFATGLLTNKVYADGSSVAYGYTAEGRLSRKTWARGDWVQYAYDSLGHAVSNRYSSAASTPAVSFAYDADQRLSLAGNGLADYAYAYSGLGTLTNEAAVICGDSWNLSRCVDGWQRPSGICVRHGDTGALTLSYGHDDEDRIGSVAWTNAAGRSGVTVYSRADGLIQACETVLDNGNTLSRIIRRDPNRPGLINAVSNLFNGALISAYGYQYNALGNRTARTDSDGSACTANAFGYNARSEVISAVMYTNEYGYVYDPIGNRLFAAENATTNAYIANCLNQYTAISAGTVTPTYDADGNMTFDGCFRFSWDAENRMVGASNATEAVCNAYDHQSRRIRKTAGNETRIFIYDGWNMTAEAVINESTGTTNVTRYVWGLDLSGSLQGAGGVGGLLAVIKDDSSVYFPCYDANGNITEYVDSNGSLVARRQYDPFGKTVIAAGSLVHDLHFWFSSKYLDEETGLYYYGYRFYSPELGRWLNRDPIEETGCVNLFNFVNNRPSMFFDPLGLDISGPDTIMVYDKAYGDSSRNRVIYTSSKKVCSWDLGGKLAKHKSNKSQITLYPTAASAHENDSTLTAIFDDGTHEDKVVTVIYPKFLLRKLPSEPKTNFGLIHFDLVLTIYDQFDKNFPSGVFVSEDVDATTDVFVETKVTLGTDTTRIIDGVAGSVSDAIGGTLKDRSSPPGFLNVYQQIHIGDWAAIVVSQLLYKDYATDGESFGPLVTFNGVGKANFH